MLDCPWPNNVGALFGLMESASADLEDGVIPLSPAIASRLADEARVAAYLSAAPSGSESAPPAPGAPRRRVRRKKPPCTELARLLAEHQGHVSAIADEFGVARKTVYDWLKKCDLDPDSFRP
jgi:transcriptional regulator of acetoin/glycerol metabolism